MILNLDAGELPSETEALWALFDVVNIACGGHAGDADSMARIVAFCAARGRPLAGAHPSYPDRAGFGRRARHTPADVLRAEIAAQCAALAAISLARGVAVAWVKPHGALYHDAAADAALARAVLDGARDALGAAFTVIGPARGALREAADALGLGYAREGFADRGRRADGSLVPRGAPGALLEDPAAAAAQARALASSGEVDTICVHGDTPGALAIARAVRAAVTASSASHPPPAA